MTQLLIDCQSNVAELRTFGRAFHRSLILSVDTFLAHRPVMSEVGKLAIAYELAMCERQSDPDWSITEDHWYRHLWNRMRAGTDDPQSLLHNALRIITFNYDRSLEFALYRAIRNTYGIAEGPAQQILDKLWIRHVYGELGRFHHLGVDGGGRQYTPIENARELQLAAASIHTIPEARANNALFAELQEWCYWAEDVAFIGFSFDETNVERLGFAEVLRMKHQRAQTDRKLLMPRIAACTYGMTPAEEKAARARTLGDVGWNGVSEPNLKFLRNIELLV